ncbi:MAG: nucleotide pyrophosphohydrolase [Candidatus Poseidoniales archaeon]|nr:MAG: nucleotide pyrophosphohydrolase [Candidatus Poseidoniales archaeon]
MPETDRLAQTNRVLESFIQERDWEQFHTVKNIIASIGIEAAELAETVQWSNPSVDDAKKDPKLMENLSHELADVMLYCLRLCSILGLDPIDLMNKKIILNGEKYPADLVRGSSAKYTDYV